MGTNLDLLNIAIAEEVYEWVYHKDALWYDPYGELRMLPGWSRDLNIASGLEQFVRDKWGYRMRADGPTTRFGGWSVTYYRGSDLMPEEGLLVKGMGRTLQEALCRATLRMEGVEVDD